jgi:hypothetical protein
LIRSELRSRGANWISNLAGKLELLIWIVLVTAYLVAAVCSKPIGVTISDEVFYLAEAQAIGEAAPLKDARSYRPGAGESRPGYPPGWPLFMAPMTRAPWPAPFAIPVALHLLGTGLFAYLLHRRGFSSVWAVLYFAQPASLLFSRTLMAESLSSVLCVGLLLAADSRKSVAVGLLATSGLLIKPSMMFAALPFAAIWLVREVTANWRMKAFLQAAAGALVPVLVWAWSREADLLGTARYLFFVTPIPSLRHVTLLLATLAVAWPGLPLGFLRARPSERAGVIGNVVILIFYGYDYIGPSWSATLVVGSRLFLPAIIMLLPGYAFLLSSLPRSVRRGVVLALLMCALVLPPIFMARLAARRRVLDEVSSATFRELRPGCAVGYTPFAMKLLVPFPKQRFLGSLADEAALREELLRGGCVDLLAPRTDLTTNSGPFWPPGFFASLTAQFPKCEFQRPGTERIVRLYPLGALASCD